MLVPDTSNIAEDVKPAAAQPADPEWWPKERQPPINPGGEGVWSSDVKLTDPATRKEAHPNIVQAHPNIVQVAADMTAEYRRNSFVQSFQYPKPHHWKFR